MKKNKKILIIMIILICIIIIGVMIYKIINNKSKKINEYNVENTINIVDNKVSENEIKNEVGEYENLSEKINDDGNVMGLLLKREDDYIEISNNPYGTYGYKDFYNAVIRTSNQTKYRNLITDKQEDVSYLSNVEVILVNNIENNYFYNYSINNYEIDKTSGTIYFISKDQLKDLQEQTFKANFNEKEQKLSNLKVDLIYKATNRYDSSEEVMQCILYINVKNIKIPYLITIYKNDETVIDNSNQSGYADIIIEKRDVNSTKENEWLLAKEIIYK